jgi:uracil-DNA glycosylase
MNHQRVQIHDSWYRVLENEFEKPYFIQLIDFLKAEKKLHKTIYPPGPLIFNAFNLTPFDKVKVVIIGQDPYHRPGQAMGLSFSVPPGVKAPPSLVNIFKEINRSLQIPRPDHGDLSSWATQGVFLLNAILTVEDGKPGAHKNSGWQTFTDAVIQKLSDEREKLVFLLWGNFAKEKKALIDTTKHFILESPHPSPLAGSGFWMNNHFVDCNQLLRQNNIDEINWSLK